MEIIRCAACNREFNSQEALAMHNSSKHVNSQESAISAEPVVNSQEAVISTKPQDALIKCDVCDKEFNSQESLAMHNSSKHPLEKKFKTSKKTIFLFIGIISVVFIGYFFVTSGNAVEPGQHDEFAKYLTEQGAVMYGTEWCSHCKNQKEFFGSSFQYINYTDCDRNKVACTNAGIVSYPTWKINGQKYIGEQSIEKLTQLTKYKQSESNQSDTVDAPDSVQKINIGFKGNYNPNTITVKAGKPVEITLDSSVRGCYRSFNIKQLGISYQSSDPSDKITFTPNEKGSFEFACGMRMGYGTIIVE